jgi:hypothetical protein
LLCNDNKKRVNLIQKFARFFYAHSAETQNNRLPPSLAEDSRLCRTESMSPDMLQKQALIRASFASLQA